MSTTLNSELKDQWLITQFPKIILEELSLNYICIL